MKKIFSTVAVLMLMVFSFSNCENAQNGINENIDITSMLTPGGGILQAAEVGNVRSALGIPTIDLDEFHLEIAGLVDAPFVLSWEEILALPAVSTDTLLMYCVEGWEVWGDWKGILVKDLLDQAKIRSNGEYILFSSVEGYSTALPISYLVNYNAILAYQVNGEALNPHDGYPLRLIAFGKFGYKWAKWVNKLEIIEETQVGYWEGYGYSDKADVPLKRRKYYEGENAKQLKY